MNFELLPHQRQFLESEDKFVLLRGGIGSGKSWIGSHFVIKQITENKDTLGLIAANTYKQLVNSTLACLFSQLELLGLPFVYNQHRGMLYCAGAKILCTSLEKYDTIRGINLGWGWLDETRDTKEEAFKVVMGRLRCRRSKKLQIRLTSSPSGFDWMHDYFSGEKKTDDFSLIHATSQDNPFLPNGYIDTLKGSYDSKMYKQEILGQVINITQGPVYYAFDRDKHVKPTNRMDQYKVWIGMDFNVNPMTASITNLNGTNIKVFDEIFLMTSNTNEVADTIKERHGGGHSIVPDSTGKALKTSAAGLSDHQILEDAGFEVMGTRNPFRIDRYNCVNNMLEKGMIQIDPKCKHLIRDLELVSYKEGTSMPDTTKDKTLTHSSDNLGYLAWYVNPMIKQSEPFMIPR